MGDKVIFVLNQHPPLHMYGTTKVGRFPTTLMILAIQNTNKDAAMDYKYYDFHLSSPEVRI